ncbi:unnamed protein product [Phytophthora lilii]|uniref:Unnamed protein product n=1 Tax=Phytophthora lilii TaxID=2077276 RepID=A0A9W6TKQ6_9STRA|nr:unnamed protein product [Phytophthora lilii]
MGYSAVFDFLFRHNACRQAYEDKERRRWPSPEIPIRRQPREARQWPEAQPRKVTRPVRGHPQLPRPSPGAAGEPIHADTGEDEAADDCAICYEPFENPYNDRMRPHVL